MYTNFKKSLGQNFLKDEHYIQKIVDCVHYDDISNFLEIGPGDGQLSEKIIQLNQPIKLIEIDQNLNQILNSRFSKYKNVDVINYSEKYTGIEISDPSSQQYIYSGLTTGQTKNLLLKGYVSNLLINLNNSFQFSAEFEDLSLESNEFSISGLGGFLQYNSDVTRLKIDTPYLHMVLGSLFDSDLIFNNFSSELDLNLIDNKLFVSNSTFKTSYKKTAIKGEMNLYPSPFDDTGDLSLKITSNNLDYLDALSLFPNLSYTKLTKDWLQKSISCGSFQEVSFIYRGPVDNKYVDSSSSFQSKGLINNSCLTVNDVGITKINLVANINNSSFIGEVLDGNLYGSEIKGTVKTFRDNNDYKIELKGKSEGPLSSILRLANLNLVFDVEEESGEQYTNFYFSSPLSSTLGLLGKNSNLELSTKIKGGNFYNKKTKLYFSDLYS